MFKKNKENQPLEINQQEISTIIGEGYTFTGEVRGASVIRIEGTVVGNINVEGGVVLGEKGKVEGDIFTRSAIVFGRVSVGTDHRKPRRPGRGCRGSYDVAGCVSAGVRRRSSR